MHLFGLVLFGFTAFFWLTHGLRVAFGAIRLPWIKDFAPVADAGCAYWAARLARSLPAASQARGGLFGSLEMGKLVRE